MKIHMSSLLHLLYFVLPLHDAFLVPKPMLVNANHRSERMIVSNNAMRLQVNSGLGGFVDVEEIVTMRPVERFFPFIAKLMDTGKPGESRNILSFLRSESSDIRHILIFALVASILPILGRYGKQELLTTNGRDYRETNTYHVLNHISQGLALSAIITFGESVLQFFLGYNNQFTTIATTTTTAISFGKWQWVPYFLRFAIALTFLMFLIVPLFLEIRNLGYVPFDLCQEYGFEYTL